VNYTVLARRYRSRDFDEVVGQEPIARTLRNAIDAGRTAHAYLFCGTRGVGKTSMARIFAKRMNVTAELEQAEQIGEAILRGDDLDVIEIDGASNRGVNEARDLIAGAGLSPARCPYKIYIIDEVHMLTREAFNALLKTMEEPPAHVKFILCTTEAHKVPATIQSRCQRFDFRAIPTASIADHLRAVLDDEGIAADDDVVMQIARLGNGSMRDALSVLDRLLAAGELTLTSELLEQMLGLPSQQLVDAIVEAIISGEASRALHAGAALLNAGTTIELAVELLAERFRMMMVLSACDGDPALIDLSSDAIERLTAHARHFDAQGLVHMIALCDQVGRATRQPASARAVFDAMLVRLCLAEHFADITTLLSTGQAPAPPAEKKKSAAAPRRREPAGDVDRSAGVTEVKPARASAPSSTPSPAAATPARPTADTIHPWTLVQQAAQAKPAIQAKIEHVVCESWDGTLLTLRLDDDRSSRAKWHRAHPETLPDLVANVVGRKIDVRLSLPESTPDAPSDETMASALREPIVKRAAELLDAALIDVQKDERPPDEPSTEGSTDV